MNKKKSIRIDRKDYNRSLITETLPFETPIIFSGSGFYDQISDKNNFGIVYDDLAQAFSSNEAIYKNTHSTIPFMYKIRKNSKDFRRLKLIHPKAQWRIKEFYGKYDNIILYYCSNAYASIRSPEKIANSFYRKNYWENMYKYKTGTVSTLSSDELSKYAPSYFTYKGFNRIYKFFESKMYFDLEKKYSYLWTLDVSKCFDSIYTHSLSWAVKDKDFTKKNVSVGATFPQEFDYLMRFMNHNETNGIVIGPEVSRIFAEIILQEIDRQAIFLIKKAFDLDFGKDYVIKRYIDDVFIFSKKDSSLLTIYTCYVDVLMSFNLHPNSEKCKKFERPFLTAKSRLIHVLRKECLEFFDKIFIQDSFLPIKPRKTGYSWKLVKNFIVSVKVHCAIDNSNYDDVSSYLISLFTEKIKNLVNNNLADEDDTSGFSNTLKMMLDVIFFLYEISPSVTASYRLCTALILIIRFCKDNLVLEKFEVYQRIYDLALSCFLGERTQDFKKISIDKFVSLENLNVLLAISELGENYILHDSILKDLLILDDNMSYFHIICAIFYFKDFSCFLNYKSIVLSVVTKKLLDMSDILMDSEKAHLFLDLIFCPYIENKHKRTWIREFYKVLSKASPSRAALDDFLEKIRTENKFWQVNWLATDLLNQLERKELRQAY